MTTQSDNDHFLPQNHPVIERHKDTNTFYLHPELVISERSLTSGEAMPTVNEASSHHRKSFLINETISPVRRHLQTQSNELKTMVFFYNETNPHTGMISNTKQILYDYFQLIGPVKDSWFKILLKDDELANLLIMHIQNESAIHSSTDRTKNDATLHIRDAPSLASVAGLLERLTAAKAVSSCKYKSSVTDNLIQIRGDKLTPAEQTVLEVIAQYAFLDYEVTGVRQQI